MALITKPAMSDDSGTFTDGTILNEAFIDSIIDEVDLQTHSTTNPTVRPKAITDEVIAARGSKASLDARLDVALNEDGTPKAVAGQATETQLARAEGNFNILLNGDLEDWASGGSAAPDDFTLSGAGAAIARCGPAQADTTDLGTGTYCAKITSGGGAAAKLTQIAISAANYSKYRSVDGRKVGFTIRGKVASSNVLRVVVDDGVTTTASAYATGSANEQDISVVHEISASATKLDVYAEVALGANVAYVGGFTAVFSDLAPAAWNPLWAKFRQDILNEAVPTQVKIGGVPKTVNASGVLISSITQATQSTNGATFYTITIPGNTLNTNGDRLRVRIWGASADTAAQNFHVFGQFGATALTFVNSGSGQATRVALELEIQRITGTTQRLWGAQNMYQIGAGSQVTYLATAAPGETLSGNVDLTIKLSTTGSKSMTLDGYVVEFLPAVA